VVSGGAARANQTHDQRSEATGIRKILQIELAVRPDSDQRGMTASGMIVINPPWKLEAADEQRAAVAAQNAGASRHRPRHRQLDRAGVIAAIGGNY
jgi:23S rRNA A2030 N6-methylase RlmJ